MRKVMGVGEFLSLVDFLLGQCMDIFLGLLGVHDLFFIISFNFPMQEIIYRCNTNKRLIDWLIDSPGDIHLWI